MRSTVDGLAEILMVGAMGWPEGLHDPVTKQMACAPPAARAVMFSTAAAGASIIQTPAPGGVSAYPTTPMIGRVPVFAKAPSDFSSIEVSPPAMLSGVGLVPDRSTPCSSASLL